MLTHDPGVDSAVPDLLTTDPALEVDALRARASDENFPVALRFLPREVRQDLLTVYAVARLIDEAGDASKGSPLDRLALLDEIERDLDAAFAGRARHPILSDLTHTLHRRDLHKAAFLRLIEANRFDQRHVDLESWEDLKRYCALSASPIGELVLQIFGQATAEQISLSNDVCCALQVVEHCQDVAEDSRATRVYLPRIDRERTGCTNADLVGVPGSLPLRHLVEYQVDRARRLLGSGRTLCASLQGAARIAVSGFVAGGMATCDALERADFDPNSKKSVTRRRRDFYRHLGGVYLSALRNPAPRNPPLRNPPPPNPSLGDPVRRNPAGCDPAVPRKNAPRR